MRCKRGKGRRVRGNGLAPLPRHVRADELHDLGDDMQRDSLALANPAQPVGPLSVVAEDHVFAKGERGVGVHQLRDVHARGVHLVVKGEAALQGDAALGERDDLGALA